MLTPRGQKFWYVVGDCGITEIAVAIAADVTPAPAPGNVIAGYFIMAVSDGVFESAVTQQ
ncbi:MAG: hypothetical protein ACRDAX_06355 [Propionibacteriaceae bacterium]